MIKRIVLVEPMAGHVEKDYVVRNNSCATSGSPVVLREPIAIQYIGGYLKSKGYDVKIIQQQNLSIDQLLNRIIENKPDVVGLSIHATYIASVSLYIADMVKRLSPGTYVIFGGNHPTGYPQVLENKSIDFVILGEGEDTFYQLLLSMDSNKDIGEVSGIAWRNDKGEIIINRPAERMDFSTIPWPMRDSCILENCKCAPLSFPIPTKQRAAAQISYSRGCTGGCEFCVSNYLWRKKLSYRDPEDVINELKYLKSEFGTNFFFLTDLTYNTSKPKAIEFCKALTKSKLDMKWFAYCNVLLDEELAQYMTEAGCSRIGFGLESVVDNALEKIKPYQKLLDISKTLNMTSSLGILNRCYMMIGFPWETEEYLEKTKEQLKKLPIDQLRVGFVVPFPGTKIFDDWAEIRSKDFAEYTGDQPSVECENISKSRLVEIRDQIVYEFYNSKEYWERCDEKIKKHTHLEESFQYFKDYLLYHGILKRENYGES